jgi:hypothetical protein
VVDPISLTIDTIIDAFPLISIDDFVTLNAVLTWHSVVVLVLVAVVVAFWLSSPGQLLVVVLD